MALFIPSLVDAYSSVDWHNPVNWDHELNEDLKAWYLALPHHRGSKWYDLTGRHYGTLTNMDPATDWVGPRGRPGGFGALEFDGVDQYVLVGDKTDFENVSLSIRAWIWLASTASRRMIFSKWNSNAVDAREIVFEVNTGGALRAFVSTNGTFQSGNVVNGGTSLGTQTWYFVECVHDLTGRLEVFVNGKSDGVNNAAPTTRFAGAAEVSLGATKQGASITEDFAGLISDVSVTNSADTISQHRSYYDLARRSYPGLLNRTTRRVMVNVPGGAPPAGEFTHHLPLLGVG